MKIEEIEEITDLIYGNGYDTLKTINELNKKVKEKDKEIERLNNNINKTIKFIENKWYKDSYYESIENCLQFCRFNQFDIEKLIEILGGKE